MHDEEIALLKCHSDAALIRSYQGVSAEKPTPTLIVAYEILESGHLREVPLSKALCHDNANTNKSETALEATDHQEIVSDANTSTTPRNYWIDAVIQSDNTDALPQLQSKVFSHLTLPPLLVRHLQDGEQLQTPQVLTLIHHAFIVMRILSSDDDEAFHDIIHTAALCMLHTIVTVTTTHQIQVQSPQYTTRSLRSMQSERIAINNINTNVTLGTMADILQRDLPEGTVSGATAVWLASHLGRTAAATRQLRLDVIETCNNPIETIPIQTIQLLKDMLLRLSAVAEEQLECVQGVVEGDLLTEAINFDADTRNGTTTTTLLQGMLRVNVSTATSTERILFRLEKRVAVLRGEYDAHQQILINKRLNVLTILSAIFLPLTLMAGIWGMNFTHMPELQTQSGYYCALGSMFIVGFGMLSTFYRYGWLS